MALLRMKDLRALTDEELTRRIAEIENDLLRERGVAAMGGAPPSPGRMRLLRTNVARALTVLNERRIAAAGSAARRRPAAPAASTSPRAPAPKPTAAPKAPPARKGRAAAAGA